MENRVFLANPEVIDEKNLSDKEKLERYNKLKQRIIKKSVTESEKKNIKIKLFFEKPIIQNQGPLEFTVNMAPILIVKDHNGEETGFEALITTLLSRKIYSLKVNKKDFKMTVSFDD